ncbi:hypothetical protein ACIQU5_32510 [Streptomyces sp. NPDC090306]|uniref:hypothetical protein n=1 Tax=Streptomyces sp. NPDC090306 TaxID=3365961 RepID=UPI00380BB744
MPVAALRDTYGGILRLWSVLRRTSQANRAFANSSYRHDVFDGCLTGTGLRTQP